MGLLSSNAAPLAVAVHNGRSFLKGLGITVATVTARADDEQNDIECEGIAIPCW